jgi:hypothetical protein
LELGAAQFCPTDGPVRRNLNHNARRKKQKRKNKNEKKKKDDIMDGPAMVEFLWTIVVVFLQLFRIVPDTDDGDGGTALSGSTWIADPLNVTVSSLIINTTTVSPSVAVPAVALTTKPSVAPPATSDPTRGPVMNRAPIVVVVPTPTKAPMAVTATTTTTTTKNSGAPAVIVPPPVAKPTKPTSSAAPVKKTLAPVRTPAATAAPARNATTTFIESFVLVYAPTNTELFELHDGDVIDLTTLSGGDGVIMSLAFNVKVNVNSDMVGAVLFAETGRRETTPPLSFCGDGNAGQYNTCTQIKAGPNTITVTPQAADGAPLSPPVAITFGIVGAIVTTATTTTTTTDQSQGNNSTTGPETDASGGVGKWVEIDANANIEARHEACFVMVTNKQLLHGRVAVLIGGRGDKRTDLFDPVTRQWSAAPAPPAQLHHMQCVAAQGKVWIMAAWTDWYPKETNAEHVYVFDPVTNSWSTKTALPEPRRRGAAAVMVAPDERTIYVSHGNNGGHETGDHAVSLPYLDAYDIGTDSWTALSDNAPHPRDHTGGAVLDNGRRLCVGGGRNGGELNWPDVAPTDCYDLTTGVWTVEASMPSPRAGSSYGVSCDGQYLLVAGGEGSGKAWNDVHAFDGQNWSKWASLNVGRHGSGLAVDCVCGNQIIIASGAAGQGGGPEITSVEIYFPNEKQSCDA